MFIKWSKSDGIETWGKVEQFDSFPVVIIKESKMLQSCRRQSSNANAIHWEVKKKYEKNRNSYNNGCIQYKTILGITKPTETRK